MEDFFYAGGLRAFLTQLGDLIDFSQQTVNGRTLGANVEGATVFNDDVIRPRSNPLVASDGLAVLTGNLAPGGAVIKPAAMDPQLRKHRGPAVVFKDYNDMAARIDDPALDVTKDSVIVLQSAGPQGAPGMPEWGQLPIPAEAAEARRARHGAHQRCAHERHQLRRLRAARHARIARRRPAGAGARRRPDRTRHRRAQHRHAGERAKSSRGARRRGSHRSRSSRAATACCTSSTSSRPTPAATSISWRRIRPKRPAASPRSTDFSQRSSARAMRERSMSRPWCHSGSH